MKFHSPMIIVSDIEKSKQFYTNILHEDISLDLGTYVIMGGFSMMARETWSEQTKDVHIPDKSTEHSFELYFEESKLDDYIAELQKNADFKEFQPLTEAPWGQRTIRFLDPDSYVIEVSEPMENVVLRLVESGLTIQEVCEKSMMPVEFVQNCIAEYEKAKQNLKSEGMNYPWFDEYCISKQGATKEYKEEWEATKYMIGGKIFALQGNDNTTRPIITLKLLPADGDLLRNLHKDIIAGYYMNKDHWNSVYLDGSVPDDIVRGMIDTSYSLVFASLTKKLQKEING